MIEEKKLNLPQIIFRNIKNTFKDFKNCHIRS